MLPLTFKVTWLILYSPYESRWADRSDGDDFTRYCRRAQSQVGASSRAQRASTARECPMGRTGNDEDATDGWRGINDLRVDCRGAVRFTDGAEPPLVEGSLTTAEHRHRR